MLEGKLLLAMLFSTILAILIFKTNYNADIKNSRIKYSGKDGYHYGILVSDLASAIAFALIGCYLCWDSITTINNLKEWENYKFIASILFGIMFQQILPILIEIAMNKLNDIRSRIGKE